MYPSKEWRNTRGKDTTNQIGKTDLKIFFVFLNVSENINNNQNKNANHCHVLK